MATLLLLRLKKSDSKKRQLMAKVSTCASCGKADLGFLFLNSKFPALVFLHESSAHSFFFSFPSLCKNEILWPDMKSSQVFPPWEPNSGRGEDFFKAGFYFQNALKGIVQKPAAKPWCHEQNEMWVLVFSLHYDRISSEVTPVHVPLSSIQTRLLFQSVMYVNNKYLLHISFLIILLQFHLSVAFG